MAEFQKVAKEYRRLCNAFETCKDCPLNYLVQRTPNCETGTFRRFPEEAERIIMQWAVEHPIKTNRMKFKEVFGFEFTDRVPESQYHREWLNAEYKGKDNV